MTNANFDGLNNGYSQNALILSGLYSGASWFGNSNYQQEIVLNSTTFDWPDVAFNSPDNVAAAGQVVALPATPGAIGMGFIGSATHGPAHGNVMITYTDSTTQTFTLSLDDWTLNGGTAKVSSFDKIAAAMTYRDLHDGTPQNEKTYLFYAATGLNSIKTVKSITLPNNSSLHIFSVGFRPPTYFDPYNNTGISDNANTGAANFDNVGYSYSMQALSQNILPGDTITYNGTQLYWPNVLAGSPDNTTANGLGITFDASYANGKTKIGFIGSATHGPSCGNVTVTFTDSTSHAYPLCFSDWTLGGGNQYPANGNMFFLGFPRRNAASGSQQNVNTYLFYAEIVLPAGSPNVASVALPASTNQGQMHFFAWGLGSGSYNTNVGSTVDSGPHVFSNLDGLHYSYSSTAMQKAGVVPVQLQTSQGQLNYLNSLKYNGITFYWDQNFSVFPDNAVANGQVLSLNNPTPDEASGTIPVNPIANPTHLAFLGSATAGTASGVITITYADGSKQTVNLSFSDWCAKTLLSDNLVALTMPYRNAGTGSQTITNHLYYVEVALQTSSAPVSVTLPALAGPTQMHIFSMGFR